MFQYATFRDDSDSSCASGQRYLGQSEVIAHGRCTRHDIYSDLVANDLCCPIARTSMKADVTAIGKYSRALTHNGTRHNRPSACRCQTMYVERMVTLHTERGAVQMERKKGSNHSKYQG